jgi:hypothetical protein
VDAARAKMMQANARLTELNRELENSQNKLAEIKADYNRIMTWSELFDESDMDVKKMIAGYIIKRVYVCSDYKLHFEFNINFAQFDLGLDIPNEYTELPLAQ